ncbi:hypothetical protein [Streptomyces sp. NBC_00859]|uniref:hypothetical protein n=1 Tax=Streptomyces sp. NBC_00859 TaxID=2903682 RepID=UPI00386557D0|nr:hypothetical protein OG584_04970 [Streptomyces sp. NBC_00859]
MTRPAGALLRLHAVVPGLGPAALARAVSRTLTGQDSPPGGWLAGRHGRALHHQGTSAEVSNAWDGPELRLWHRGEPAAAGWAAGLLDRVSAVAAGTDPAAAHRAVSGPDRMPARRPEAPAYLAWRALLTQWQIAPDHLAEINAPGLLTPLLSDAAEPAADEPVFVFDHAGPPKPPPGWLLRGWFAPDAGVYHCSVLPGSRLSVRSPEPAAGSRCAELLAAWQALTACYDAPAPPLPAAGSQLSYWQVPRGRYTP